MNYYPITNEALTHLSSVDRALAKIIATYPRPKRKLFSSPFECLVSCIVQQQISGKVAEKIFAKIESHYNDITAQNLLSAGRQELCSCGISEQKADTILNVAQALYNGVIDFDSLDTISDFEIEKSLLSFKGIGIWMVEMFLIFALARSNIFSTKDLGIRRAFSKLHPDEDIKKFKKLYSPFGTTATIYLWQI